MLGNFTLTGMMGVTKLHLVNTSAHLHHFTDCVGMFCRFETVIIISDLEYRWNIHPFVKAYLFLFPPDVYWAWVESVSFWLPDSRKPWDDLTLVRLNLDRKWLDSADQLLDSSDPVLRGVLNWRAPHMQTNNTAEWKQSRAPYWNCIIVLGQLRWSCQHLHILCTRMHTWCHLFDPDV